MNKLKLLYIIKDFRQFTVRNFAYLSEELDRLCDLRVCHVVENIPAMLERMEFTPDFILLQDYNEGPFVEGLETLEIPIGMIIHDVHAFQVERRAYIEDKNITLLFPVYKSASEQAYPEYVDRMLWFPHFVNTELFRDYGHEKTIDILMMGAMEPYYYPLRNALKEKLMHKSGFVHLDHPGYKNIDQENTVLVGKSYAEKLNQAKLFLTCDSRLHYPLMKYFEVLACKTLLLAPTNPELEALGFIPGKHFVEVNEENVEEKVDYYLINKEEREAIAFSGFQFVREIHSLRARAAQLVQMISLYVEKAEDAKA